MGIEALKTMKDQLVSCIQGQLGDISKADTHEMGEAVDMVKDLAEAIYYCTITESMEKGSETRGREETNINYYTTPYYNRMFTGRDPIPTNSYMYYSDGNGSMNYYTQPLARESRDPREGRSPMRRRLYMEGKAAHNDPSSQLRELEAYLQQLSTDITEMIKDASPEERATLHQKMTTLANKIS